MSLLAQVAETRKEYLLLEANLADLIVSHRERMDELSERLDTEMVYAVDWGKHSWQEVAMVAGYKSKAAIRDARKRIEKREAEVR